MTSPASGSDRQSRAFALLADPVRRWIWNRGWTSLRDIQENAIPYLIEGDGDLIIAAATAGGKTEAALLPLISKAHTTSLRRAGFDLVYVGPLRALINDQFRRLEDLCELLEMPVHPWHGDIPATVKARARKNPGGIVLITPESLEAMFVRRGAEVRRLFAGTQAIVVDELHALLDTERGMHLQSLLARIEIAVGRRIRRVGLSATLGDLELASAYLRREAPDRVRLLRSRSDGPELRVQLRAYLTARPRGRADTAPTEGRQVPKRGARRAVAEHLFEHLRGRNNLVYAGRREDVELFADLLRRICDARNLPQEFFPHHSSLAREHRTFVEKRLRGGRLPVTAICTSTLELGIDIGEVACVGQIGAPWSVAALRQRLGRSGRRPGQPSVLRMYAIEPEIGPDANPLDRLHLNLVRSVAMVELLIAGWCEPPREMALHLSTLTHQILSVIAERGGASAKRLFSTLCQRGPFRSVDPALFGRLLRRLGDPEVALIEQAPDGALLLGRAGERIVEHYSFYASFQTPEEYQVSHRGEKLGTIPVTAPLTPGLTIILGGRRWRVVTVHPRERIVEVAADRAGKPPLFGGDPGDVHEVVVQKMRTVLVSDDLPRYLDDTAAATLAAARAAYRRTGLEETPITRVGERYLLAPWTGTVATATLEIALVCLGHSVDRGEGVLGVSSPPRDSGGLIPDLKRIAADELDLRALLRDRLDLLLFEKFHRHLGGDLLLADALSRRLDLDALPGIARDLCSPT